MKELCGIPLSGGVGTGRVFLYERKNAAEETDRTDFSADRELSRLTKAIDKAKEQLAALAEEADAAGDDALSGILSVHALMLEDDDILDALHDAVTRERKTAPEAVKKTEEQFVRFFEGTGDATMQARCADVRDVMGRVLACLSGEGSAEIPQEPVVLVTDEVLPCDIAQWKSGGLIAVVTRQGAPQSHAAILLRASHIPAVSGIDVSGIPAGTRVAVNGNDGKVTVDPDPATAAALFRTEETTPGKTFLADGKLPFRVYANIGGADEADETLFRLCGGIGVFRTEYLYYGRQTPPSEEEQVAVYRAVLARAQGKPVTVRTFDVGADKISPAIPLEREENPALGCRGLRVYARYPDLFRTQIRAILRAAVYGDVRIMYPMITSRKEMEELRARVDSIAHELARESIPYRVPKQGAMIETPAAAILSSEIARVADFFSVGTNDLTQYTLALDRQNGDLDVFRDKEHRAVLALVKIAAENAHAHGIEIGICGEIAADPALTETWIRYKIDDISVSSGYFH